jgi:hypothetical protein
MIARGVSTSSLPVSNNINIDAERQARQKVISLLPPTIVALQNPLCLQTEGVMVLFAAEMELLLAIVAYRRYGLLLSMGQS